MVHTNDSHIAENTPVVVFPSSSSAVFKRGDQDSNSNPNLNSNSVIVEEFPRGVERTEIVRLKDVVKSCNSVNTGTGITECSFDRRRHHRHHHQVQRQRKISARFSLFNWFKKNPAGDQVNHLNEFIITNNEEYINPNNKNEPAGLIYSSNASVDTTCSTATVHSFTFKPGPGHLNRKLKLFRKHCSADDFRESSGSRFYSETSINFTESSDKIIFRTDDRDTKAEGAKETTTNIGELDKQIIYDNYRSLPSSGKTADITNAVYRNKKRYSHVRGKRKAPEPPGHNKLDDKILIKEEKEKEQRVNTHRRKRQAPKPPILQIDKDENTNCCSAAVLNTTTNSFCNTSSNSTQITFDREAEEEKKKEEEKEEEEVVDDASRMLKELVNKENIKEKENSSVISIDTLKLKDGVLLQDKKLTQRTMSNKATNVKQDKKVGGDQLNLQNNNNNKKSNSSGLLTSQNSNVQAPRPWYKRSNTTLSERDICGSFKKEVFKIPTLNKLSKDKGFGLRFSHHHEINHKESNNHHNHNRQSEILNQEISTSGNNADNKSFSRLNHFFGRNDSHQTCKTKKDEKRKSNLSILTNISELDREAAAIVQEEQAKNQALLSRSFPTSSTNDLGRSSSGEIISEIVSSSIEPQRRGTRALISKFNAISNITKVTVNATFFAKSSPSSSSSSASSTSANQSAKIERVKTNNRNDRIVTKRLLYDGEERVNETAADISSINFFRRLEAEASKTPDNEIVVQQLDAGWEEKIKRYFPEREKKKSSAGVRESFINKKESDLKKQRDSRNIDKEFEYVDSRNRRRDPINVDKIEHLSRADLKEMLIEMKHSLPKRPKPKSNLTTNNNNNNNDKLGKNVQHGISQKAGTSSSSSSNKILSKLESTRNRKSIAGEDEVVSVVDKAKVSSGVQTSANLRKIELPKLREKHQVGSNKSGWKLEDTIYTTKVRNSEGGAALSRNTFQLIRPRDFACIEALKTEKIGSACNNGNQNTYMNVIEDSIYANTVIHPPEIKSNKIIEVFSGKELDNGNKIHDKNDKNPKIIRQYVDSGVTDVKHKIGNENEGEEKANSMESNMNTLAINRLLRKLEGAIASGQHQQAAGLAKELAQLKIHCSVVRQRSGSSNAADFINVDMYIEDKLAHQGPIPLQLSLNMTVADLKKKVFAEFEIPANVQRWIIGKNLADNDDFTINELKAVDKSSIFLYLVAPDLQNEETTKAVSDIKPVVTKEEVEPIETIGDGEEQQPEIIPIVEEEAEIIPAQKEPTVEELKLKRYEHLMSLENSDVIPNSVPIECPICFAPYGPCEGVILRDCLHMFCRTCIANTIMYCEEAEVKCPFRDSEYTCESTLQEREIKALVTPELYEQHLAKSVSQAENSAGNNAFHCKTPDCRGWCIYDDNVNTFLCPVCGVNNCLTCQAIHTDKNCREYQDELRLLKETDQETKRTAAVLEEMVESGEALACPTCAVVLMKKWGCDWLRCSMCKTEICWVTRGPRWGPAGKGDTSGGCKCGENGVKCHPRCNYCH